MNELCSLGSRPVARNVSRAFVLPVLLACLLVSTGEALAQADVPEGEKVVMVYEEPRHRLVVDQGDVKVLDVQIQPGDTTFYHTHDSPILYTFINLGDGPAGGRVRAVTEYADEPLTHEVTNDGTDLFRILAVAHYGPGVSDSGDLPAGVDASPRLENRWFRSYRFELAPGEETSVHRHRNPVLVVRATEGRAEVLRDDGFGTRLDGLRRWAWLDPGVSYRLHNPGDSTVAVVVNEARRGPEGG